MILLKWYIKNITKLKEYKQIYSNDIVTINILINEVKKDTTNSAELTIIHSEQQSTVTIVHNNNK